VLGYHVYRANDGATFARISDDVVAETQFTDPSRPLGSATYLVRAIALHVGPSGSYYNASQGAYSTPLAAIPTTAQASATAHGTEVVWFDDALPPAAVAYSSDNDRWNWVANPTPASGAVAHQSDASPGLHQHFFAFTSAPLRVNEGETLFTYVYLDAANPPREVILTWLAGDWEHRAYWGENLITEGADGGPGRRNMGALPELGKWVRLEIPASAVGMENQTATGMGFTLYNGRATWDRPGKSRR
jgi:hypothetical protein